MNKSFKAFTKNEISHTPGESPEIPHGKVEESINLEYKFQGKWVDGIKECPAQKLIGKF